MKTSSVSTRKEEREREKKERADSNGNVVERIERDDH